jgi:putrescine aminotransferase
MEDGEFEKYSEKELLERYKTYISSNHADFLERLGLAHTVQEAKGAVIVDSQGKSYIDFMAGYGIFNLGHNPPTIIQAIRKELDSAPLWNRFFLSPPLINLAERLVDLTSGELNRVFICSTGAEAIDSAIKLARLSTRRPKIITASGAFHGYTLGALSLCGIPRHRRPFEPLLPEIEHVPFNDPQALASAVTEETAAVLLEPIQAEIGGETPSKGYLDSARKICDKAGALLIVDEIRTGMGRTGPLFAVEQERIVPDILVIGKALAGGIVPIGAILARSSLWGRFGLTFSMSASSFAGNRLACVAANEMLNTLEKEKILEKGKQISTLLWAGLNDLPRLHPDLVQRITGRGLLIGIHFANSKKGGEVIRLCIAGGLLVAAAFCNNRCLLIEPPLVLEREQGEIGLEILKNACRKVEENQ